MSRRRESEPTFATAARAGDEPASAPATDGATTRDASGAAGRLVASQPAAGGRAALQAAAARSMSTARSSTGAGAPTGFHGTADARAVCDARRSLGIAKVAKLELAMKRWADPNALRLRLRRLPRRRLHGSGTSSSEAVEQANEATLATFTADLRRHECDLDAGCRRIEHCQGRLSLHSAIRRALPWIVGQLQAHSCGLSRHFNGDA